MSILVTGAIGFMGSHFIKSLPPGSAVGLVRNGKVGDVNRLGDSKDIRLVWHDLKSPISDEKIKEIGHISNIVHFAAETHVDRSITNPQDFVESNIMGTFNLLEYARKIKLEGRFLQFSTDEVFGPAPKDYFYKENDVQVPKNPYAATKSASEALVYAWANTYGLNISIVRSMNIFGQFQNAEKFIPLCIRKIMNGETIYIHSDKTKTVSGSRYYIHASNVVEGVTTVLFKGENNKSYHCVGEQEVFNLDMAKDIASYLGKELKYEMVDFHSSRPGHDLRYALANENLAKLNWKLSLPFNHGLMDTIEWYMQNKAWCGLDE